MGKEELVRLFDEFLNSNGLWNDWKDFVEQQGHTVKELGFEDD